MIHMASPSLHFIIINVLTKGRTNIWATLQGRQSTCAAQISLLPDGKMIQFLDEISSMFCHQNLHRVDGRIYNLNISTHTKREVFFLTNIHFIKSKFEDPTYLRSFMNKLSFLEFFYSDSKIIFSTAKLSPLLKSQICLTGCKISSANTFRCVSVDFFLFQGSRIQVVKGGYCLKRHFRVNWEPQGPKKPIFSTFWPKIAFFEVSSPQKSKIFLLGKFQSIKP